MHPTLSKGDKIIARPLSIEADELSECPHTPRCPVQRGELVLLYPPYVTRGSVWHRFIDRTVRFFTLQRIGTTAYRPLARRVIGFPGDRVRMEGYIFYLKPPATTEFASEFTLSERSYRISKTALPPQWERTSPFSHAAPQLTVPYGTLFVAADNRTSALDSRHWAPINASLFSHRVIGRWNFLARIIRPRNS